MIIRINLTCIFGFDISGMLLDYEENRVIRKESVSFVLGTLFNKLVYRFYRVLTVIAPWTLFYYITGEDKEILRNVERIRNEFNKKSNL